jgi:hypothetical protein
MVSHLHSIKFMKQQIFHTFSTFCIKSFENFPNIPFTQFFPNISNKFFTLSVCFLHQNLWKFPQPPIHSIFFKYSVTKWRHICLKVNLQGHSHTASHIWLTYDVSYISNTPRNENHMGSFGMHLPVLQLYQNPLRSFAVTHAGGQTGEHDLLLMLTLYVAESRSLWTLAHHDIVYCRLPSK